MSRTIEAITAAIKASNEKASWPIARWTTKEESEAIVSLKAAMGRLETVINRLPKYDDKGWVEGLSDDDRALVLFFSINMTCEPLDVLEYILTLAPPYKEIVRQLAHQYFVLMAVTEHDAERRYRLRRAAEVVSGKEILLRTYTIYMMAKACGIGPQYPVF